MQLPIFERWQHILRPDVQTFLATHSQTPIDKVALLKPKFPAVPFPEVLEQLDSLRKVGEKMPAWAGRQALLLPSLAFQQASSEVTALFKNNLMQGEKVADLTGGLGVDSFYLAQTCRQVFHVEASPGLQAITRHNFAVLGQENVTFCAETAEIFLEHCAQTYEKFDAFYIDPARRGKEGQKLVLLQDYSPNVVALLPAMLELAPHVWLKTSPLLDISQAIETLGKVAEVFVLAHKQEVKELLFHLTPSPALPTVHAVSLEKNHTFSYSISEEASSLPAYSEPLRFLYEPLPALMKAGAFKVFATRYGLAKLHPHTHLYTSQDLQTNLPARIFEIKGIYPYKKNALPTQKANITTRNFRDSVAQIRQKLRIAEGGEQYIFATTLPAGEQVLILTEKM